MHIPGARDAGLAVRVRVERSDVHGVCVCVCEREREREVRGEGRGYTYCAPSST